MVFLAMSWFLSTKIEKTQKSQQLIVNSHQSLVSKQQTIVNRQQETEYRRQNTEVRSQKSEDRIQNTEGRRQKLGVRKRKPSKQLREIDAKPSLILGIPVEREKTWQLSERKAVLGPQALVKISLKEEPLPLRGGLGVSAPKEIKKIEVFPPNCLLKKE